MSSPWTVQYYQKVLALDPIAYWMLDEKSGTVAYDMVSGRVAGAQNGAYTAVTLGQPGIGDGRTSGSYDGATSYTNIYSAALASAFDATLGTLIAWAKVSGAAVWTDGSVRHIVRLGVDANNEVYFFKAAANDLLYTGYDAGGVSKAGAGHAISGTDWYCFALSWDKAGDVVKYYRDGVQIGATLNGLGVWAGSLSNTATAIGAGETTPVTVWSGMVNHVSLWNRVLTIDEIADLAVVE